MMPYSSASPVKVGLFFAKYTDRLGVARAASTALIAWAPLGPTNAASAQ